MTEIRVRGTGPRAKGRRLFQIITWVCLSLCLMAALISAGADLASAHEGSPASDGDDVVVDEKLGNTVPLELRFVDETGQDVALGEVISLPTVLSLAYLSCTSVCPQLLAGTADALARVPAKAGIDYQVITVSFDEHDTPAIARKAKENYLAILGDDFPPDQWRFLTGTRESIRALTKAVGFGFRRDGKEFLHPVTLLILSPEGKIVRYLYGKRFLPLDLRMALTEASEGRVGSTVGRVLLYCFRYDPENKTYAFATMRVFGVSTTLVGIVFFLYLVLGGRKRPLDTSDNPSTANRDTRG